MSRPIHAAGPPSPPPASGPTSAPADASAAEPDGNSIFGALLDSRSEARPEEPGKSKEDEKKQPETLSALAVPIFIQFLPPAPAPLVSSEIPTGGGANEAEPVKAESAGRTSAKGGKEAKTAESKELLDSLIPLEKKVPESPLPKSSAPEEIAGKEEEKPSLPSGIPAAQQGSMRQAPAKTDEKPAPLETSAGSLRIDKFETAAFEQEVQRPDLREAYAREFKHQDNDVRLAPGELLSTSRHAFPERTLQPAAEVQAAAPISDVSTADAIRGHVQLLRTTGQDRLEVTLRPDGNTQLFLAVAKVDGRIQVQARCERGDFALLEAHWGAVQSSLSAAGIQVQPLEVSSSAGDQSLSHFGGGQQQQQQTRNEMFQETLMPGESATKVKPQARKHLVSSSARGWQSWA